MVWRGQSRKALITRKNVRNVTRCKIKPLLTVWKTTIPEKARVCFSPRPPSSQHYWQEAWLTSHSADSATSHPPSTVTETSLLSWAPWDLAGLQEFGLKKKGCSLSGKACATMPGRSGFCRDRRLGAGRDAEGQKGETIGSMPGTGGGAVVSQQRWAWSGCGVILGRNRVCKGKKKGCPRNAVPELINSKAFLSLQCCFPLLWVKSVHGLVRWDHPYSTIQLLVVLLVKKRTFLRNFQACRRPSVLVTTASITGGDKGNWGFPCGHVSQSLPIAEGKKQCPVQKVWTSVMLSRCTAVAPSLHSPSDGRRSFLLSEL